jgi:toxin FitB
LAVQRFLLDTNVISETSRVRPDEAVHGWLNSIVLSDLFVSAVSLGELRYGVERLPPGRRRSALETWLTYSVELDYAGRVLPFDGAASGLWGALMRQSELMTGNRNEIDMQIAATAVRHGLILSTRNTKDFAPLGVQVIDPWTAGWPQS